MSSLEYRIWYVNVVGQLQGRVVTSPTGKVYYSFQAIPYAKPQLGSLRFKAPEPPEPWEGSNPDKIKMDFWDEVYSKHFKIWQQPKDNNEQIQRKVVAPIIVDEISAEIPKENVIEPEVVVTTGEIEGDSDIAIPEEDSRVQVADNELKVPYIVEETVLIGMQVTTAVTHEETFVPQPAHVVNVPDVLKVINGNGIDHKESRASNEINMVQQANGIPKDVIRANEPPENDLAKNKDRPLSGHLGKLAYV
ncbi:hypothetical protein ACJJTC_013330 [Scirpophaga incertulas]